MRSASAHLPLKWSEKNRRARHASLVFNGFMNVNGHQKQSINQTHGWVDLAPPLQQSGLPAPVSRNPVPLGGVIGRVDGPLEIGISLPNHVQHGLQNKRSTMKRNEDSAAQLVMSYLR